MSVKPEACEKFHKQVCLRARLRPRTVDRRRIAARLEGHAKTMEPRARTVVKIDFHRMRWRWRAAGGAAGITRTRVPQQAAGARLKQRKPELPVGVEVARYMGAGLTWALSTLAFLLLGAWVGTKLGSRPVGAVIGAFIGAGAGFYWLIRQLTPPPGGRGGGS